MKCAYLTPDLRPAIPRFRFPVTQKVLSVGGCTLVGIHDRREHSMCWKCDNPQATVDDYLENLWQTIKDHRWAVQSVAAGRGTVGGAMVDAGNRCSVRVAGCRSEGCRATWSAVASGEVRTSDM